MGLAFCPRCGVDTSWFPGTVRLPYCGDCGWNLDEVYRLHHKHDRPFMWGICGFAVVISVPMIISDPRQGILALGVMLAFSLLAIFLAGSSKPTLRLKATMQAVAQKPGSDLSSAAPETMPPKVVAYGEALRSIPRPRNVRLTGAARGAILMLRVIAGMMAFVAIRDLVVPPEFLKFAHGFLPIGLLFCAALVWFLVPIPLRKDPRLDLLLNGEVILARMTRMPQWWRGGPLTFEFHDANGRLIRGQGSNHGQGPVAGTYVPVFYDRQNPENCAPAFTFNCDLVLPQDFAPSTARSY